MHARKLKSYLPQMVIAPGVILVLTGVYGFIAFSGFISFSDSRILPSYNLVGWENYEVLFSVSAWETSLRNLGVFAFSLYRRHLPFGADTRDPDRPPHPL
jgi:glucose/mannose transport system permease protein